MNDELKAIVDRMHRHEAAIKTDATFKDSPHYHSMLGEHWTWDADGIGDDYAALARCYLSEHLADDGELVTEEWLLKNAGFVKTAALGIFRLARGIPINFRDDEWFIAFIKQRRNPTRGDVRLLCRALGIELKEASVKP